MALRDIQAAYGALEHSLPGWCRRIMDAGDSLSSVGPVKVSPDGAFFLGGAEGNEHPTDKPGPRRPHEERGGDMRRKEETRGERRRDGLRRFLRHPH